MAVTRLKEYRAKRDFSKTAEPSGDGRKRAGGGYRYLIQKHDATRTHFDFRLEWDGVLLSWAVPNGPSLDPKDKRLAVRTEDHPLDYGDFEGTIPKGQYGGGTVMLWDEGTWEPVGDVDEGLAKGDFKFILDGERLKGKYVLVRMRKKPGERGKHENWLLIKERDEYSAEEKKPIIERAVTSVRSGRTMDQIAEGNVEWTNSGFNIKKGDPGDTKPAKKKDKTAKQPLPRFSEPQLATLVEAPPTGDAWVHEIKLDGYRAIAAVAGGEVKIYTRKGLDWTKQFRPLVRPIADLPCGSALLDGEVAVADKTGRTDFGALQVALGSGGRGMAYYLFDLLFLDGEDLRKLPLTERKAKLARLVEDQPRSGPLFYSDHIVGNGAEMLDRACSMKLEGIISKRADAPYRSGRSKGWLKSKCGMGQEFIIVGWRESDVSGRPFSSILLGTREGGELVYRGRVGSGFGERELAKLWPELKKREVKSPAVENLPAEAKRDAHFVRPELVAEIEYRGMTDDGIVRQGSFKGLRADKPAAEIVAEVPKDLKDAGGKGVKAMPTKAEPKPSAVVSIDTDRDHGAIEIEGVKVTHPNRVVFPGQGITKKTLCNYFLGVADLILPHVADRPLSLVRCPQGAAGDCFFQKHASPGFPKAFKPIRIKEKDGSDIYLYIEDVAGLIACVQMGALELHVWGSHIKTLERPDRIVFDFDPDEGMEFSRVRDAATDMRARLKSLGLESFPMVTGGKGIHVVVPLTPRYDWDDVKDFAEALARTMAAEEPDRFLAVMSKAKRVGKIFVDYLRNGRGATAIAPFSTRTKKGAPVAWPVSWQALPKIDGAQIATVTNAAELLKKQKKNPWAGYFDVDQVLPLGKLKRK